MVDEEKKIEEIEKENNLEEAKPEEPLQEHFYFPWKSFIIVFGVIITLIIICVIVILCNGGFYQWG